ncbi:YchJ family protein [Desulforhopalus singaporensis]|uniref:SEC-C motif-containing protein n=1 Tax=Desulforhopalus singaporensis TaxID=91360 RepID=A0A1H0QMW3_9BACT|nr:YchJ family metal-binding protein [Desulforhopalus singaporensis]SDP18079.1 SEC-C motif-containing protein [Desulforhopalus singaporensis]
MITKNSCPCGSTRTFSDCCAPILQDPALASTAEMLMRSRYTAFVQKNTTHILATWHSRLRPPSVDFDHKIKWTGLAIHEVTGGTASDITGVVEFTATYIEGDHLCRLTERSDFEKKDGLWFYAGGKTELHRQKIARNSSCPCGSGKKAKRCCLC